MLTLSDRWAEVLALQPETGMGYQVASIILRDGRRFDNVTIVGGTISESPGDRKLPFCEQDISEIIVTHGKPGAWTQRT